MRKIAIVMTAAVLWLAGVQCGPTGTSTSPVQPKYEQSRVILEQIQTVDSRIIPDSTKKGYYPIIIDHPWVFLTGEQINRIHDSTRSDFINKLSASSKAIVFLSAGYNHIPVSGDIGGGKITTEELNTPFIFKTTKYNAKDSTSISITNISSTGSLTVTFNGKSIDLPELDSLSFSDTLLARTDSTWCYQEIVITHKLINHGYDDITKSYYSGYFW
jgi:hypothetical protein